MTTATLRPNATVSETSTTLTGAASRHAATSDDSDASYVTGSGAGSTVTFGLGTTTLPAGAITKQIVGRWRGRADVSGSGTRIEVYVPGVGTPLVNYLAATTSTIADFSSPAAPATLTQSQIDGATIELTSNPSATRWMEAYLDLVYVTIPVVAVDAVSPDPYTASTTVPISWTNTLDSDGGAQTRYEVKVFTDAQYGAGGFNPDTSTPYDETGVVVSAATTVDVGPLENGDTYRAYVRVAQTVNGALHWSDWDYDELTMDVTTSDVDTVTATAADSTASITVTVAWDAASTGWEYIEVQRSIDGGATWADVRGATYVETQDSGATDFAVVDYEVGNGTEADYRARATYLSSGQPITGAWVQSSSTSWSSSSSMWVKAPNNSGLNRTFRLAEMPLQEYPVRQGVFQVLGAARPVVVTDVRSDIYGLLTLHVGSAAEATALRALLAEPVLLIHPPASWDLDINYIAPGRAARRRGTKVFNRAERWAIDYVDVDPPADPDAGR